MIFLLKRNHGYTLIEVMLVLVIIAIVAAISSGSLRKVIENYRLNTAINDLISFMYKTKQLAILNQSNFGIEILSSNKFGVYKVGTTGYIEMYDMNNNFIINHNHDDNNIIFYPLGTMEQGTIEVYNTNNKKRKVITSTVGRIRKE